MKSRPAALLAAVVVVAAAPAAARAATFTVGNGNGSGPGSLRDAIEQANAAGGADRILFDGPHAVAAGGALPAVAGPAEIDGAGGRLSGSDLVLGDGGPVTVTRLGVQPPARIGSVRPERPSGLALRRFADGGLRLSGTLAAGGRLDLLGDGGANWLTRMDGLGAGPFTVPVDVAPGATFTATLTSGEGTSALADPAPSGDITSPTIAGARTVDLDGNGMADTVRLTTSEPLHDASGYGGLAFAGVSATGASTGGAADDAEFDATLAPQLPGDATPAVALSANPGLADPAGNQLLTGAAAVPARDEVAPRIAEAIGLSRTQVAVRFGEPLSAIPAAKDFSLSMAGQDRAISQADVAPDGRSITLTSSSSWPYGSAGEVRALAGLTDRAGNSTPAGSPATRVFAAPGDVTPPKLETLSMKPRAVCFKGVSRVCRRPGATISYNVDEPVTIGLAVRRARSRAVSTVAKPVQAGAGSVKLSARVEGRRLSIGSYTVTVTATDPASNQSRPQTLRFKVKR